VRAYATGSKFNRVENPEAWLRRTALNLQRNRWRKLRNFDRIRHRLLQREDLPDQLGRIGEHAEVVDALRQIPEHLRVVLVLHYLADRSVEQIAVELGIATGTVKSRLSRGRQALSEMLGESRAFAG
jgi:RNA polymerase sigma-70 factor (ECF subfamily)